ncbi:DUF2569 family protein [Bradyrhizobium sp. KB893862 SZCCT0404]|uniref:DUF2569 family protein n=1 Tax=Bradyrhizobium sp. KB893862 SZCCT0404 TaxID=2807672 RepID=UPI001BA6C758|nr:DUF2569 family protein [Bradyrhizobium sp. KB893862 SZCCT0404]MBR1179137.1 DUF2569 family protein [Bradyrhizobium sp. KB893862 SZCCT0404]
MASLWFYAEGGQKRGPVTISELLPLLGRIADARRVLVWRQGLGGWKPVEEVREIADQLFGTTAVAARGPAVLVEDAAPSRDVDAEETGISGWLGLLAIGQVLGILRLIFNVRQYLQSISEEVWTYFPTIVWGEIAMQAALIGLAIWTTVLLFQHSRRFPAVFIVQTIFAVLMPLVDLLCVAVFLSAALNRPFSDFFNVGPGQAAQMAVGALIAAAWIIYVVRSRRVANTFTN